MKTVCKDFHLTEHNEFYDKDGYLFEYDGSPEIKIIKAGDGRNYIMDLMRLSVRDANYKDVDKYECCVIRNELMRLFLVNNKLYAKM